MEKDRYKVSKETAEDVGRQALLVVQKDVKNEEEMGREMIAKVDRARAEDHVCKSGHRFHILDASKTLLYCRRCGAVISANG